MSNEQSPVKPVENSKRFGIEFERHYALASRLAGVDPGSSAVEIDADELVATFGPWTLRTQLSNIDSVDLTGPYAWFKVMGPPHLSLRDRGLTFGGNSRRGVCIHFRRPVKGIEPAGLLRHPALTVTVEDPEQFIEMLRDRLPTDAYDDVDEAIDELDIESHDELTGYTAAELREIARNEGLRGVSKLKKDELIDVIERSESDG